MAVRSDLTARPSRYLTRDEATTNVEPLSALTIQLKFLTSVEYVVQLLTSKHAVSKEQAVQRARRVVPYAQTALFYLTQAAHGPDEVAGLPAYYAALNLIKVCILFGKHHARLDQNRHHGAQYDVLKKQSRSLWSEEIVLHPQGAIPLYYETITGQRILRKRVLRLRELYCYIPDVAAEWQLATGSPARLAGLGLQLEKQDDGTFRVVASLALPRGHRSLRRVDLQILLGFTAKPGEPNVFVSNRTFAGTTPTQQLFANCFDPLWAYRSGAADRTVTPIYSGQLVLFQELPVILALFHLSSVVRYKPEFHVKLRDSKFGPVIATITSDVQAKLLYMIWSYLRGEEVVIVHEGRRSAV
jgi:YaaC-like protein